MANTPAAEEGLEIATATSTWDVEMTTRKCTLVCRASVLIFFLSLA